LARLGIEVEAGEIVTSGWATASYLRDQNTASALVLGSTGLSEEIEAVSPSTRVNGGEPYGAVVVGYSPEVSLGSLQEAVRAIDRGARFIATDPDRWFPTQGGRALGTGSVAALVEAATGVRPVVVGKPNRYLFEGAALGLPDASRIVMVGDNPETDILGAHQMGWTALLVASAAPRWPAPGDPRTPDATIPDLSWFFRTMKVERAASPTSPWPESISPGVAAVITDADRRVLLVHRLDNGLWGLPSGHVERGETVRAAIIREVREETGLNVEVVRLIGVYSDPASQTFVYPSGAAVQFVTCCFHCRAVGGEVRPDGRETRAVAFFDEAQLPHNLLPMHPRWLADARAVDGQPWIR
jgi:HAD superfamily hydrolase (TIGR01450 family)